MAPFGKIGLLFIPIPGPVYMLFVNLFSWNYLTNLDLLSPQVRMAVAPMDTEQQKSLTALFELTKQMLMMKQQLNLLSPYQIAGAENIFETLENRLGA